MKKLLTLLSSIAVLLVIGALWLHAAPAPTPAISIGTASAFPATLAAQTPTTITVIIPIPDNSLIPGSVNLLRLGTVGTQPTILGKLHDDGVNGDVLAGDGIYSFQVGFTEPVGHFTLVVSAAFRGRLERALSNQMDIAVTLSGVRQLPPDPGSAGLTTLAGIDSDGDGVRDDVQRYIALTSFGSAKLQVALTQIASAYLSGILHQNTPSVAVLDYQAANYAIDCLDYVTPTSSSPSQLLSQLESQILNTHDRITAYLTGQNALPTTNFDRLPKPQQQKARCLVNPDTLPN